MKTKLKPKANRNKFIYLLHGPNLGLDSELFGVKADLASIVKKMEAKTTAANYQLVAVQSEHEGAIMACIQQASKFNVAGIILNAGAWNRTSIALRTAVGLARERGIPTVEVCLPNKFDPSGRESLLVSVSLAQCCGSGVGCYLKALKCLNEHLKKSKARTKH